MSQCHSIWHSTQGFERFAKFSEIRKEFKLILLAFIGGFIATIPVTIVAENTGIESVSEAGELAGALVGQSIYIAFYASANSPTNYFASFLATRKGTRFFGANLTEADLSYAVFKGTDFGQADLTRVN